MVGGASLARASGDACREAVRGPLEELAGTHCIQGARRTVGGEPSAGGSVSLGDAGCRVLGELWEGVCRRQLSIWPTKPRSRLPLGARGMTSEETYA